MKDKFDFSRFDWIAESQKQHEATNQNSEGLVASSNSLPITRSLEEALNLETDTGIGLTAPTAKGLEDPLSSTGALLLLRPSREDLIRGIAPDAIVVESPSSMLDIIPPEPPRLVEGVFASPNLGVASGDPKPVSVPGSPEDIMMKAQQQALSAQQDSGFVERAATFVGQQARHLGNGLRSTYEALPEQAQNAVKIGGGIALGLGANKLIKSVFGEGIVSAVLGKTAGDSAADYSSEDSADSDAAMTYDADGNEVPATVIPVSFFADIFKLGDGFASGTRHPDFNTLAGMNGDPSCLGMRFPLIAPDINGQPAILPVSMVAPFAGGLLKKIKDGVKKTVKAVATKVAPVVDKLKDNPIVSKVVKIAEAIPVVGTAVKAVELGGGALLKGAKIANKLMSKEDSAARSDLSDAEVAGVEPTTPTPVATPAPQTLVASSPAAASSPASTVVLEPKLQLSVPAGYAARATKKDMLSAFSGCPLYCNHRTGDYVYDGACTLHGAPEIAMDWIPSPTPMAGFAWAPTLGKLAFETAAFLGIDKAFSWAGKNASRLWNWATNLFKREAKEHGLPSAAVARSRHLEFDPKAVEAQWRGTTSNPFDHFNQWQEAAAKWGLRWKAVKGAAMATVVAMLIMTGAEDEVKRDRILELLQKFGSPVGRWNPSAMDRFPTPTEISALSDQDRNDLITLIATAADELIAQAEAGTLDSDWEADAAALMDALASIDPNVLQQVTANGERISPEAVNSVVVSSMSGIVDKAENDGDPQSEIEDALRDESKIGALLLKMQQKDMSGALAEVATWGLSAIAAGVLYDLIRTWFKRRNERRALKGNEFVASRVVGSTSRGGSLWN